MARRARKKTKTTSTRSRGSATTAETTAAADQTPGATQKEASEPKEARTSTASTQTPLQEAEAKRDEYLALAQRVQADFDNYRKRIEREMVKMKRDSLCAFLREFLAGFDDLDRAIAEGEKDSSHEALHSGIKLVRDNLWKVMAKSGVQEITALHEKFDPAKHEAMTTLPSPDHAPNTVMEVFQPGYLLDDFVLRPARVIVAAAPADKS